MEWDLSPEQDAYQEAFRGWLVGRRPRTRCGGGSTPVMRPPSRSSFADGGWAGVGLPEELAGKAAAWSSWR